MTRLILDHYRRWFWVLLVVAAAEFGLGWLIASGPEYAYEFWTFCLALWSGAVLLSFDFQRGLLRPVAVLPMTGPQLGRSWWTATVLIPAIALAGLMFSGAAACGHFRPSHPFPTDRLVLGCLFTAVWLGIEFALIFNATRGFGRTWGEFIFNSVLSWFAVVMFFGSMLLCQNASKSPVRSGLILVLGGALTVVGWLRATRFDPATAGLYLGRIEPPPLRRDRLRQIPSELKVRSGQSQPHLGYGGMVFLVRTMFLRGFSYVALMAALLALLTVLQGQLLTTPPDFNMMAVMGSFMSCWFLLFFQFMPLLRHLRLLRTVPVSPTGLAAALLALVVLPLLAVAALVTPVAWAALGPAAALTFLSSYTFTVAMGALCVFFAVWRGAGMQGYSLLLFCMVGSLVGYLWLQGHFPHRELPLRVAGLMAAAGVLAGFVLTRHALIHSSQVYRFQADPFGRVLQGQQ